MSKPNRWGVYVSASCEIINLPTNNKYTMAAIRIAQDDDDKLFRLGLDFGTPNSGWVRGPFRNSETFKTRQDVIKNGLKIIIDKVPGYKVLIEESQYANLLEEEIQLSLF